MPLPLSDEFYTTIAATLDWPRQKVADELGCALDTVVRARMKVRKGWTPTRLAWESSEDEYIRTHPDLSAENLASNLPGRSAAAVSKRRQILNAPGSRNPHKSNPASVQGRPLIARTCLKCGRLLSGIWFGWEKRNGGRWKSTCRACGSEARQEYAPTAPEKLAEADRMRQATSLNTAELNGQPWLDRDMEVLADGYLSLLEKALRLRRSYYAVANAVRRFGFSSALDIEAEADQWWISNPNAEHLDEIRASVSPTRLTPMWEDN